MKIFAALMILAAVACSKQEVKESPSWGDQPEDVNHEVVMVPMSFSAGKEEVSLAAPDAGAPAVRSYIDGSSVLWESADKVAVYDDVDRSVKHEFDVTPGVPATGATLDGEVAEGSANFYAVYPAAAASGVDGSVVNVTVPAAQVIPAGKNIDPAALVSVAYATKGNALAFKNVCGFLELTISYANVKSVTVSGTKIAGAATVTGSTGVISSNSSATDSITLTYEGDAVFPTGTYYIALLPGTTAAGSFTVSMTQDIAGFTATKTSSVAVEIERKGGFTFGTLDTVLSWQYLIGSVADLQAWNARSAEWQDSDMVKLTADINMNGESWTAHDFSGTFDGQNHKIYNIVVLSEASKGASFILTNTGTVQNLVIGSSDGSTYDGSSKFQVTMASGTGYAGPVYDNQGTIQDVTNYASVISAGASASNIGGIAAQAIKEGAVFLRCYNHGAVSLSAAPTVSYVNMGGVLGMSNKGISMTYCDNCSDASVGFTFTGAQTKEVRIGGVFGCIEKNLTTNVENCNNYQNIVFENCTLVSDGYLKVGGIGGLFSAVMDHCNNNGNITFESTATGAKNERIWVGGVVAHAPQIDATHGPEFSYCINNGNITSNLSGTLTAFRLGGVVGMTQTSSFDHCDNNGEITIETLANFQIVGGVVGIADAGGTNQTTTITSCKNLKLISITKTGTLNHDAMVAGGIIARCNGATGSSISDCVNSGDIEITSSQKATAGGIVGHDWNANTCTTLSNNRNSGDITVHGDTYGWAGGIVGWGHSSNQCVVNGDISTGIITANTGAGALLGRNTSNSVYFTFKNCKVSGTVNGNVLTAVNFESYLAGSDPADAISGTTFQE